LPRKKTPLVPHGWKSKDYRALQKGFEQGWELAGKESEPEANRINSRIDGTPTEHHDRAVINTSDERQTRDGLSVCTARLSEVATDIAAQQKALALMTARGDKSERKLGPVRHKLRDGLERQKRLVRLRELYGQRLQTLLRRDYHEERNAVGKKEKRIFIHSADYRSIKYNGIPYLLTKNQSTIIKRLHEAHLNGTPALGKDGLLSAIEAETSRVRDSFKGSPLWGILIVSNCRPRGTYRLNLN